MSEIAKALLMLEKGHSHNIFDNFFGESDVDIAIEAGLYEWIDEITDAVTSLKRELAIHKRALEDISEEFIELCDDEHKGTYEMIPHLEVEYLIQQATAEIDREATDADNH